MLRAARPKLSLTVPTVTSPTILSAAPKSPFPIALSTSPSVVSPNTRLNTEHNARGFASLSSAVVPQGRSSGKGCMKKRTGSTGAKHISFSKETRVNLISPMPSDYHGTYRKMSKDEVKWIMRDE